MSGQVLYYTVRAGDTVQLIAQRVLGDATLWSQITIVNNLDYPFIVDDTADKVEGTVAPGDTLIIPLEVTATSSASSLQQSSDIKLFGSDLVLADETGNMSLDEGGELTVDAYGDLSTVGGLQCLAQDLVHRLVTERGSLPYHPEYGSDFLSIVGRKNDIHWTDKASIELVRTFTSDPRVLSVTNASVKSSNDQVFIDCSIQTISGTHNLSQLISG